MILRIPARDIGQNNIRKMITLERDNIARERDKIAFERDKLLSRTNAIIFQNILFFPMSLIRGYVSYKMS